MKVRFREDFVGRSVAPDRSTMAPPIHTGVRYGVVGCDMVEVCRMVWYGLIGLNVVWWVGCCVAESWCGWVGCSGVGCGVAR